MGTHHSQPSPHSHLHNQLNTTANMSWDKYVSDQLLATGYVQKGAICGLDGSVWSVSEGWGVQGPEITSLANAFKDPSPLHQKGIVIAGEKYMFLSATDEVLRGKKQANGVHIAKTNTAMIIGYYADPVKPGQCANAVESLSDYLKGVNY